MLERCDKSATAEKGHSGAKAAVAKDRHPEAQHTGIDNDTVELMRVLSAFKRFLQFS
jgi:glutaredoxin-related protein